MKVKGNLVFDTKDVTDISCVECGSPLDSCVTCKLKKLGINDKSKQEDITKVLQFIQEINGVIHSAQEGLNLRAARERIDKILIAKALSDASNNLSQASRLLDVDRGTLRELMQKYGFKPV